MTVETPLTLFLNDQEIVTMMTIGDFPDYLALGYLLNQGMLAGIDEVIGIDHDEEIATLVVRTRRQTDYEEKLRKRTLTSGCAQGTVFGDLMDEIESVNLDKNAVVRTRWLHALTKTITATPSLYLKAGAIHGCVLCEGDRPLVYMEDVGRHNAVDKIAGYMAIENIPAAGKIFYTTGRLTSEMVIKTARMNIPVLISRSGFTAWGRRTRPPGGHDTHRPPARQTVHGGRRRTSRVLGRPLRSGVARGVTEVSALRNDRVAGTVLAGGLARRMGGGDKGMLDLGGRSILDHVIARLRPQVRMVAVNVNDDVSRFDSSVFSLAPDMLPGRPGPLAGVLAGLDWTFANVPGLNWIVTVPTDTPFLPVDLVERLHAAAKTSGADMACAASAGRRHPVVGLWPVHLRNELRQALIMEGVRKIDAWTGRYRVAEASFSDRPVDPFFNINTPEDLATARTLLARLECHQPEVAVS